MKVIDILRGIKDSVYKEGTVFQSNWFEDMIVKDDGIGLSLYWLKSNTQVVSRYIEEAISADVDFYILNYKETTEEKEIEEIPLIKNADNTTSIQGEDYNYTMKSVDVILSNKINELVREVNKLKRSDD